MRRYPALSTVVTHGFPWRAYYDGNDNRNRIALPKRIFDLFKLPQCHLQLLFPIMKGSVWAYTWSEAEPTVELCVKPIGVERLIYGTDMPMMVRFRSYSQTDRPVSTSLPLPV